MENLYDYYFHYNIYTREWCAILRDTSFKYLNGETEVVSDKNINNLIKKIKEMKKINE